MFKTCRKCNYTFGLENFHKFRGSADGHKNVCKQCACNVSQQNYAKNRERHKKRVRDWQKEHRDKANDIQKRVNKEIILNRRVQKKTIEESEKRIEHALAKGKIYKPCRCEICGHQTMETYPHLYNPNNPLEVTWACNQCYQWISKLFHKMEHKNAS